MILTILRIPKLLCSENVKWHLLLALVLVSIGYLTDAHSTGAPNGEACRNLYPGHGVDKQYGHSSYRVSVLRRYNDTSFVVTIYSPSDTFLGFIMQARLFSDREMLVNGVFSTDEYTQALDCLGGYRVSPPPALNDGQPTQATFTFCSQNTLTHSNALPKYKIESVWTPPKSFASDVVFRATVVQTKSIFWTAIDSEPIDITSNQISSFIDNPNSRVNTFNIHNRDPSFPSSQVPNDFVVNKDNPSSPYHVSLSSPHSPFLSNSQQPLVQSFSRDASSRDLLFYMDYNVCSRKLCIGLPSNCLRKRNCIMMLTMGYVPFTDSTVEFEIIADHNMAFNSKRLSSFGISTTLGSTSAFYSMAFSHDRVMGKIDIVAL